MHSDRASNMQNYPNSSMGLLHLRMTQVQDAPTTINHVIAEGRRWVFELEDELHTRFTGTAIELAPKVLLQAAFHDGDVYQWHKVGTGVPLKLLRPPLLLLPK